MSERVYYPLTSPQLSIWYTERMYPGTSISNVAGSVRIKEDVDFGILEKAIQLYIKNNDGLRLHVCMDENGEPRQYINEYQSNPIEFIDFSQYEDPIREMHQWSDSETLKPLHLLDSDLYHFVMVKLSNSEGGFYAVTHHIVSDAWSMIFLGNSIVDYYSKLKKEARDPEIYLPKPSYVSFIESEKKYLESERFIKDKTYWEKIFETFTDVTILKTPKTKNKSAKAKRKTFIAPQKFTQKLKEYCAENKITPYPLFLSALAMYINRVTAKEDIVIGTPILNRHNHEDRNTVGMFISTIPLRVKINSLDSFDLLSKNVINVCASAYRHQRYPYETVLKHIREKNNLLENPYDIVLSYQNMILDKTIDVDFCSNWHFNGFQANSLIIHINHRNDEDTIVIDYDYHDDLYFDKEIDFLHHHLLSLLWHALDNNEKSICKIEMLPENEKKKILYDFNNTYQDYPCDKTIQQLFEAQVKETPDNIAIIFENKSITYKELNEKANYLANVLREKSIKPDDVIGLFVKRSLDMIIGIFAILKAGGAYLPIEQEYPDNRISFIVKDSNLKLIIVDNTTMDRIDFCEVINIHNQVYDNITAMDNIENINRPNDLAYIIYTSGTIGKPKGVMIEHRSVINFIYGIKKIMKFNTKSIVLSYTSVCFDIFVFEIFTSLLSGSMVVLATQLEQRLPHLTYNLIVKHKVNKLLTTPSKMRLLLSEKNFYKTKTSLQEIMLGGEVFPSDLLKDLESCFNARIINGYGPTETTVGVSFKIVSKDEKITIGKPIANTKFYIFDKYLNLCPIGVKYNEPRKQDRQNRENKLEWDHGKETKFYT